MPVLALAYLFYIPMKGTSADPLVHVQLPTLFREVLKQELWDEVVVHRVRRHGVTVAVPSREGGGVMERSLKPTWIRSTECGLTCASSPSASAA